MQTDNKNQQSTLKMKASIECYPCLMGQVLNTVNLCGLNDKEKKDVMVYALNVLAECSDDVYPQEIVVKVNKHIRDCYPQFENVFDPYCEIKSRSRQLALQFRSTVQEELDRADDRIEFGVKCAALGNIIDFGANAHGNLDVEAELAKLHELAFAFYDYPQFSDCLKAADTILYIGDNVGEDVFDKALILEIKGKYPNTTIDFAVREEPIINDATLSDAGEIGMGDAARVLSSGSVYPGTILSETTEEFRHLFASADMVISKGQGNYETLCDEQHPNLFFLLRAKCSKIANKLHVEKGAMVLKKG
jgi:hypothetical protein